MSIPPIVTYDVLSELEGKGTSSLPSAHDRHHQLQTTPAGQPRNSVLLSQSMNISQTPERTISPPRSTSPTSAALIASTNALMGISTEVHTSKLVATLTNIVSAIQSQARKHNSAVAQMLIAGKESKERTQDLKKELTVQKEWTETRDRHWQNIIMPTMDGTAAPPQLSARLDDRFVSKSNYFIDMTAAEVERTLAALQITSNALGASIARLQRGLDPSDPDTIAAEEARHSSIKASLLAGLGTSDELKSAVAQAIKEALSAPLQVAFLTPSENELPSDDSFGHTKEPRRPSFSATITPSKASTFEAHVQSAVANFVGQHIVEPSILSVGEELRDLRSAQTELAAKLESYRYQGNGAPLAHSNVSGPLAGSPESFDRAANAAGELGAWLINLATPATAMSSAPTNQSAPMINTFEVAIQGLVQKEISEVASVLDTEVPLASQWLRASITSPPSSPQKSSTASNASNDPTGLSKSISNAIGRLVKEAVEGAMGDLRKDIVKEIMGQINNGSIAPTSANGPNLLQSPSRAVASLEVAAPVRASETNKKGSPADDAKVKEISAFKERLVLLETKLEDLSARTSNSKSNEVETPTTTGAISIVASHQITKNGRQSPMSQSSSSRPTSANNRNNTPPVPANFHTPLYGEVQQLWNSLRDNQTETKAKSGELEKRITSVESRLAEIIGNQHQQETIRKMAGVAAQSRKSNSSQQRMTDDTSSTIKATIGSGEELLDPNVFITNSALSQHRAKVVSEVLGTVKESFVENTLMRTLMTAVDSKLAYLGQQVRDLQLYSSAGLASERAKGTESTSSIPLGSLSADGTNNTVSVLADASWPLSVAPSRQIDDLYIQISELRAAISDHAGATLGGNGPSTQKGLSLAQTTAASGNDNESNIKGTSNVLLVPRYPKNDIQPRVSSRRPHTGSTTAGPRVQPLSTSASSGSANNIGLGQLLPKRPLTAAAVDNAADGCRPGRREPQNGKPHSIGTSLYPKAIAIAEHDQKEGRMTWPRLSSAPIVGPSKVTPFAPDVTHAPVPDYTIGFGEDKRTLADLAFRTTDVQLSAIQQGL